MIGFCKSGITTSKGWMEALVRHGLDSVPAVYASPTGEVVIRSRTSEVRRLTLSDQAPAPVVYVKCYWFPTVRERLRAVFRGGFLGSTKVKREYENLKRVRDLGLDAPTPVAYGEERRWGFLTRSYLISVGVPNPRPLDVYIRDELARMPSGSSGVARNRLIEALARYTRRMHDHHFVHHDYFWRNILLSGEALDRFFLIDAHKGRRWHGGFGWRLRARDLAALDAPAPAFFRRTERLRFFLWYCGQRRLAPQDKKTVHRILTLAAPLRTRQLDRVRNTRPTTAVPLPNGAP
jgi:hypothetical protein